MLEAQLNLNDFNLESSAIKHINKFLADNQLIIILKLSKNIINPNKLIRL